MKTQVFTAILTRPEGIGTWTYVDVPFDVEKLFGKKSRIKVKGTVNNVPYRSTLLPHDDDTFYMVVNKAIRDQVGVHAGDSVSVKMSIDTAPREIPLPDEFEKTLKKHPVAKALFETLSYTHKKEYVEWILAAKKEETRQRRIENAIVMLSTKKSPKQRP
jgi:hypothetical protein